MRLDRVINTIHNIFFDTARIIRHRTFTKGFRFRKQSTLNHINILGTGPSLRNDITSNPKRFIGVDTIVVNDFALGDYYELIRPGYYIFADPGYWWDADSTTAANVKNREKLFEIICSKTLWDLTIFVPYNAQKFFHSIFADHKNIKICTFNSVKLEDFESKWANLCLRNNWAAPCANVLTVSIYLAINMGYPTIKIFGADHSWTQDIRVNSLNQVCTVSRHYYDMDENNMEVWLKGNNQIYTMSEILFTLSRTFGYYEILNKYARQSGSKIYNCSSHSYIDAFDRDNF